METVASNVLQTSKLLFKALIIGGMAIVLLIPSIFVQNIVKEREARQKEAVAEVSSKWAGAQVITGPILVVPYNERKPESNLKFSVTRRYAYFLPDKLEIRSKVNPERRHRGIYEVMLYSSEVTIRGKFAKLPLSAMQFNANDTLLWGEAMVCMGISDPKGLRNEIQLNWNDSVVKLDPGMQKDIAISDGFSAPLMLAESDAASDLSFSANISLNGSEQLLFTPVGRETSVEVTSPWADPSFTGNRLPASHSVSKEGFVATWKNLSHTRKFPQQWKDNAFSLTNSLPSSAREMVTRVADSDASVSANQINEEAFGVSLFVPVNGYQGCR